MRSLLLFCVVAAIASAACSDSSTDPTRSSSVNGTPSNVSQPGPSPTPVVLESVTEAAPGIDPNARPREIKPGSSPIPGIPNAKDAEIKVDPNVSPAPGIPSENEMKRMMKMRPDPNEVNNPKPSNSVQRETDPPTNKSRRPLGGKVE